MDNIPENPKAFPGREEVHRMGAYIDVHYPGMTLRDYFAAKAMQGDLSNSYPETAEDIGNVADLAYRIADAMLKERAKP